jgi:hypothetical protein
MAPIDDAIAAFESQEPGEKLTLQACADEYGVERSTLGRRIRGRTRPIEAKATSQQKLNPRQEMELVEYIGDLTKRGLPPTREMIQNFASEVAQERLSESWVTRFIKRNHDSLIIKWSSGMDANRHSADSYSKYKLYFDLLHDKITQYDVQPYNIYNIDEKGFMIGVLGRSKRVFSRHEWEKKEVTSSLQDGSREWVTTLAAVCADGTALPPSLIYQSNNSTLQDSWVADIKADEHEVFITSSSSGWTNNEVGLAWLEQVFDRCTKKKARRGREWRLLIVDGHGSHLTQDFLNYCESHRILLAVFPPHSTHTLQPLDVVCFKPLSTAYSNKLSLHLQKSQGLVPIKKGDFFPLFWEAWGVAFKKETILSSFEATGVWPMNPDRVLKRFKKKTTPEPSSLPESDWVRMERLLRSVVHTPTNESKRLSCTLHHLQVQNELLNYENDGLREALITKKKHKKKGKVLDLQQRQEFHSGAVFWSPGKIREARARRVVNEHLAEEEKLQKADSKKLKAQAALYKKKIAEEKRVAAAAAKEERERVKAEKATERARQKETKEAQNNKKALQNFSQGKRKALSLSQPKAKRQKRVGGSAGGAEGGAKSVSPTRATPPKMNSRGRPIKLPHKYK